MWVWILKHVPAWILAVCAITIAAMVLFVRYEVGFGKDGIYFKPEHVSALVFSSDAFRQLAGSQLSLDRAYYSDHQVEYTIVSLDSSLGSRALKLQINTRATVKNPSDKKPYEFEYVILVDDSVETYSARVNGIERPGEIRGLQGRRHVSFGKVSLPPLSTSYIEETLSIFAGFPFRDNDITRFASEKRSLAINVPGRLNDSLTVTVGAVFDRTFLEGPLEEHVGENFRYTWKTRPTGALFPYQGFVVRLEAKSQPPQPRS